MRSSLLGCWLLAWFGAACAPAPAQAACDGADSVPWQAVAPGIWVWPGANQEISPANGGHVVPTSLVVDGGEAAVIDPGPSLLHGERVRRSVACRFGARVRWVLNTHAHAENVLANAAFADVLADKNFAIVATPATQAAMKERCPNCLASLTARAGDQAMAGTRIVWPTQTLAPGDVLGVGALRLQVLPIEQGHTEGDLVLWHAPTRTVWAGGLAYFGRVPELSQGGVDGWLAALDRLDALAPRHVIATVVSSAPSAAERPPALVATRAYLQGLRDGVLRAMDQGEQPQAQGQVSLPGFAAWAGYAERHAFNVQRAWREMEPVWMDQGSAAKPSAEHVGR